MRAQRMPGSSQELDRGARPHGARRRRPGRIRADHWRWPLPQLSKHGQLHSVSFWSSSWMGGRVASGRLGAGDLPACSAAAAASGRVAWRLEGRAVPGSADS